MIDVDEARTKVRAHLGSDDFELEEFPEGWRVIRPIPAGIVGTPTLAVERTSGALLRFGSAFPPNRVTEDFELVRPEAWVIEESPGAGGGGEESG
jgi:hypothetical protein